MTKSDSEVSDKLNQLLERVIDHPQTEKHYLLDTINRIRNQRMKAKIHDMARGICLSCGMDLSKAEVLAVLKSNVGDYSNESQEVQDMLNMLKSYWKLPSKRYIDEVSLIITSSYTSEKEISNMCRRYLKPLLIRSTIEPTTPIAPLLLVQSVK